MKLTVTLESKFDIGDIVTYNDNILTPIDAKIIDIKLSSKFEFLYRLEGSGIYRSDNFLTLKTKNDETAN